MMTKGKENSAKETNEGGKRQEQQKAMKGSSVRTKATSLLHKLQKITDIKTSPLTEEKSRLHTASCHYLICGP